MQRVSYLVAQQHTYLLYFDWAPCVGALPGPSFTAGSGDKVSQGSGGAEGHWRGLKEKPFVTTTGFVWLGLGPQGLKSEKKIRIL